MKYTEDFELISYEELIELEANLISNPFDTTGCGYIEDDLTDEIRRQYKEAYEYYELMDNINL